MIIHTWQLLVAAIAGWVNQEQRDVIAYIMEENKVLKEQLKKYRGRRRLLLTDDQRRRLAAKAKTIGRRMLREVGCIFTPDTIMRWYARLVAMKYDGSRKRGPGRPRKPKEIRRLVVRIARENPTWGYTRIMSALRNLKCDVGRTTVQRILAEHGLEPSPQRSKRMSWAEFLAAHWEQIAAADFFTVELMTLRGLVRYWVLFVMELSTRAVHMAGAEPSGPGQSPDQPACGGAACPRAGRMQETARRVIEVLLPEGVMMGSAEFLNSTGSSLRDNEQRTPRQLAATRPPRKRSSGSGIPLTAARLLGDV